MIRILNQLILLAAVLTFVAGCATMQSRWEETRSADTIQAYEEFIRQYPNHAEAHYLLGVLYERQGFEIIDKKKEEVEVKTLELSFLQKAQNAYERVLILNSAYMGANKALQRCKAKIHFVQGVKNIDRQPELAIQEFNMGIGIDPDNYSGLLVEMHNNIGNLYNRKGWYDKAVAEFEKAFEIDPDMEALRYNLPYNRGLMYLVQQNDLNKAEESIQTAIKADPNRSKAQTLLGIIYRRKRLLEASIRELKRAIAIDPNYAEAHIQLGMSYNALGHYHEAIDPLTQGLRLESNNAEAYMQLGAAYSQLGQHQKAIESYKQAFHINPNNDANWYFALAESYAKLGQHQEAIGTYKQGLLLAPNNAEAYTQLGLVYSTLGHHQEAIEAYKRALIIKPNVSQVLAGLGIAYIDIGDYQKAVEAFRKAILISPDNASWHFALGVAYSNLERYQESVESYKQVIRLEPNNSEAHFRAGIMYLILGNKRAAQEQYEILKNLDQNKANQLLALIRKSP
jgi:superkiller protein 3